MKIEERLMEIFEGILFISIRLGRFCRRVNNIVETEGINFFIKIKYQISERGQSNLEGRNTYFRQKEVHNCEHRGIIT